MAINPSPELERISRRIAAEKGLGEEGRVELIYSYLDFLGRASGSPEPAFPSLAVDEIWHRHILDTKSYQRDCQQWFGTFIHHQPDSVPDEPAAGADALADCSAQEPAPEPPACVGIRATLPPCSAPTPAPPCKGFAATSPR